MHGLVESAFFSVMVLVATFVPGLPSQRVGQASAGEADQVPPLEQAQSPSPTPSNGAPSVVRICDVLARGSMGWARVHVGTESRAGAEKLCTELRTAGATCTVLRN